MAAQTIKVLHIDTEYTWRGGQQQAIYLHEALSSEGIYSALVCQPHSELLLKCRSKNLKVIPVKMFNELDIFAAVKIARICKRENFNFLHCHSAHSLSIGILIKLFMRDIKLIGVRRVDFHIRNKWKYNNKYVDKVVCISDKIKKVLIEDAILEEKLITIKSGIDINKFKDVIPNDKFRNEFNIDRNKLIVGTIAAFVGHKDYYNFVSAASIVCSKKDNVVFVAVGDGELLDEIKLRVHDYNLDERFIFTGYRTDIGEILKTFDVFVLASKKEGLGTSILDAQSTGLPVIATNTGGIPEIIEDGVTGIIVEPRHPEVLASAIIDLVEDDSKRNLIGLRGKESVSKFDIKITVAKNIELYNNLLQE
ncbi:MAG: glycosyltransferase family 4 protein [Bacteroidetes bacterium]|nr:glycosyltransferase family 4 protein [Bacteroidota bacterium]